MKYIIMLIAVALLMTGCGNKNFDMITAGKVTSKYVCYDSDHDDVVKYTILRQGGNNFIGHSAITVKVYQKIYAPNDFACVGDILCYTNGSYKVIN